MKIVVWLTGASLQSPPFSQEAKLDAGYLIWRLQNGALLQLPSSRAMPSIGKRCHELRIQDKDVKWRIVYRDRPGCDRNRDVLQEKDSCDAEGCSGDLKTETQGV